MASASVGQISRSGLAEIYVRSHEGLDKIFVATKQNETDSLSMAARIRTITSNPANCQPLHVDNTRELSLCLAIYRGDWYRARIISIYRDPDEIMVEYIDYGNMGFVGYDQVLTIPENEVGVRTCPRMAVSCRLTGDHLAMDYDKFVRIVLHCDYRFFGKVDATDQETGQISASMYFDENNQLKCVNELIVRNSRDSFWMNGNCPQTLSSRAEDHFSASYNPEPIASSRDLNGGFQSNGAASFNGASSSSGAEYMQQRPNPSPAPLANGRAPLGMRNVTGGLAALRMNNPAPSRPGASSWNSNASRGSFGQQQQRYPGISVSPKPPRQPQNTTARCRSDLDDLFNGAMDQYDDDDQVTTESRDDDLLRDESSIDQDTSLRSGYLNDSYIPVETPEIMEFKRVWGRCLKTKYPRIEQPPSGTSSAETFCIVTQATTPRSFCVQTKWQQEKLSNLYNVINDGIQEDPNIPESLVEGGLPCAVLDQETKRYIRGRVKAVRRDASGTAMGLIELVDFGLEQWVRADSLKPLKEQFVARYPGHTYRVQLGPEMDDIEWTEQHAKEFRRLVLQHPTKSYIIKFLTSDAFPEVDITDPDHRCLTCTRSLSKTQKMCSVNTLMREYIRQHPR